jgi:hypothetical protein
VVSARRGLVFSVMLRKCRHELSHQTHARPQMKRNSIFCTIIILQGRTLTFINLKPRNTSIALDRSNSARERAGKLDISDAVEKRDGATNEENQHDYGAHKKRE